MNQLNPGMAGDEKAEKLPPRDWLLLPMLGILTIALIGVSTEIIARHMFSELTGKSAQSIYTCMVMDDASTGVRAIPNSVCKEKFAETPSVEYKFNSCGHRAGMECGAKEPGTYRIVIAGSSFPLGARVREEETFAPLLSAQLSQQTGQRIEIYNASVYRQRPGALMLQFNQLMAGKPDSILWILTPSDIQEVRDVTPSREDGNIPRGLLARSILNYKKVALGKESPLDGIRDVWSVSRSALLLQHYLYESQSQYVKSFLSADDDQMGFLKAQPSAAWQERLKLLDGDIAEMHSRAAAAGMPLMVTLIPNRAEAAMVSMGEWPGGFNPYSLDSELESMTVSHGATYIDILQDFRTIPDSEHDYFPVDGHPNAGGQAIIARLLARELIADGLPPGVERPQAAIKQAR